MPTIRQVTCTIESGDGNPLAEYGTSYTDGFVHTYVLTPPVSKPFSIRLLSDGYIAPGLAMFVYMDGVYQCNRNRLNLKLPHDATARSQYEVNLRVRQKEEKLQDGTWYGKEWRFEKLSIGAGSGNLQETMNGPAKTFDHLGTIEVVVLRCHADPKAVEKSSLSRYSISPETSNFSNTDMSEKPDDSSPTGSPLAQHQSSSSSSSSAESSVVGLGIFDGACDDKKNSGTYGSLSSMPLGLDGNWDDPHPPGPDGRPRKEWTWSVKGNQGVYHRIGEQPFQAEEPRGRAGRPRSHRPPASPHFGQDWETEARRDERSRDHNHRYRSPSRRSPRRHNLSPQERPPSHRSSAYTAQSDSHRGSHAGENDLSTGWRGVPATSTAPAIIIQVQQAPPVTPSIHSRGRSRSREHKHSSRGSSGPSPPPRSVDSWGMLRPPLTPSEMEQQQTRFGSRPSRASHAHSRVSDAGGGKHNGDSDSIRSHKASRSHRSNEKPDHQGSGNNWVGSNNNNNAGGGHGWSGGNNRGRTGCSWGRDNNSSGANNGWSGNDGGANTSGGHWGNGNGDNTSGGNGQAWGAANGSNALQRIPGSWASSPVQEQNDSWGGGANATTNEHQTGGWAQSNNDHGNNTTNGAWGGGGNTTSGDNQWNTSSWNPNPAADNTGTNNDTSWGSNAHNKEHNAQSWNSGNAPDQSWHQKPSSNSGNNNWNGGNNNDNSGSGVNAWEQKPSSQAGNNDWKNGSNDQNTGTSWTAPNNAAPPDWAANIRKIFAQSNNQATESKPNVAPQQQSAPVHGFYSLPNSPVVSPQVSPPQQAPSHQASLPQSQHASLRKSFNDPAKATFATIKPYWAKWHDTQSLEAEQSATEEPIHTVTEDFIKQTSTSHHVQPGKPAVYSHRIHRPVYIDRHNQPYAVFVFKYRSKEVIEQILGSPLSDGFDDVKSRLSSLSREELVEELLKTKAAASSDKASPPLNNAMPTATTASGWGNNEQAAENQRTASWESTNQQNNVNNSTWNDNTTPAVNNETGWNQPTHDNNNVVNTWQNNNAPAPSTWTQPVQSTWQPSAPNDQITTNNPPPANDIHGMSPEDYENYVSGGTDWLKNFPASTNHQSNNLNNNNATLNSWPRPQTNPPSPLSIDLAFAKAKEWKPYIPDISPFSSVKNGGDTGDAGNLDTAWGGGQLNSPVAETGGGDGWYADQGGTGEWGGTKPNPPDGNGGGEWGGGGGGVGTSSAAPGGGW